MKQSLQSGVTLIELMIVLAIIGILAAFALPVYSDYSVRTRVIEGLVLANGLKTSVTETFATQGPRNMSCSITTTKDCEAMNATAPAATKNVKSIESDDKGVITITYDASVDNGHTLVYRPMPSASSTVPMDLSLSANGGKAFVYVCRAGDAPEGLEAKFVPAVCK